MISQDIIDNIKEALLDSMHFDDVETLEEAGMLVDDDEQGLVLSMPNGNRIILTARSEDDEVESHVEVTVESDEKDELI